jgi:MoxR-like ATPase
MKDAFVGKDEIIDLMGVCLVGGENLFILGPPGTAKSALVQDLSRRLDGRVFDYLLTRFTEPNERFGPFDIRKLREGELITNTEGMLPASRAKLRPSRNRYLVELLRPPFRGRPDWPHHSVHDLRPLDCRRSVPPRGLPN